MLGSYINSLPSGVLKTSTGNSVSPVIATLTVTALTSPQPGGAYPGQVLQPVQYYPWRGFDTGPHPERQQPRDRYHDGAAHRSFPFRDDRRRGRDRLLAAAPWTLCRGARQSQLTGGILPANGSCTVSVSVIADCGCTYYNSVSAGALLTDNGSNAALAAATLTVTKAAPGGLPKVSKYFYPDEVKPGATTTLTITLTNPDATVATLTAPFTDHLPSGMVLNGLPTTAPSNTCGGVLSAAKGSSEIILTGARIPINGSCRITVFVMAEKAGTYINALPVGVLKTSNGSNPTGWKATLTVSPSAGGGTQLIKSFSPSTIANDGVSMLTIMLKNPYGSAATLTAPLVDHMPSHMVVFGTARNTCGGVVTAVTGSSEVTLTGGAIPAKGSCQVTVSVTAPCNVYFNNLPAGALQTSNGTNQEPAGSRLTVLPITR